MRFDDYFESDDLLDALWDMHFDEMTPIQEQAIPQVLDGRDLLACAQTGTGKTAAYLLPVIDLICTGNYPEHRVNCVIMAPTRELAQQIDRQMQGFSYFLPISSLPIYGGTDGHTYEQQRRGLKMGADVVIATPGRLIAHLQMGSVDLSEVSFFILDEADRMLDMGFYDDIMNIASHMPKERQTLLFSATMPPKIQQLAKSILRDPAEIKLAVSKPADKIEQVAYLCAESAKEGVLRHVLSEGDYKRVIVFSSSKLKVKQLARQIRIKGLLIGEMHSDLDQTKREDVMLDFKSGKINVLIATDIVARGIDIDDIELVVNYDVPREGEDYVHRVGRTARADRDGRAVTLVSDRDRRSFQQIERLLGQKVKRGEMPAGLQDMALPELPERGAGKPRNTRPKGRGGKAPGKPGDAKGGRRQKPRNPQHQSQHQPQHQPQNQPQNQRDTVGAQQQSGDGQEKKRRSRRWRKKPRATSSSEAQTQQPKD
ncbi:MAG: DEAD/DEAH box helicase [Muribaculaceae bacterium]|nr:DEAD/DEAH box helicase [Muribaculaceae bacterium]